MKIAFTSVTFRKKSIEKIVEIALKNDVKNIEWGGDIHLPYGSFEVAKRIKELTDCSKINNISYGSYYVIGENDLEKFGKICEVANIIGAKIVRVWLGKNGSKNTSDGELNRYRLEACKLCEIAMKVGLIVACEFHNNTCNDSGQSAVDFIKKVNAPNLMTMWQPLGNDKDDINNLIAVMPYLCEVHVFNWDSNNRRKLLAENNNKWNNFFEILRKNSNVLPTTNELNCVLEFVKGDSARAFKQDILTLKKWCEQYS
ncbi:MAG: hypothetical protein RR454_01940 [Clostridia bacterium]